MFLLDGTEKMFGDEQITLCVRGHFQVRLTLNVRGTIGLGDRTGWNKRQKGRMERVGSFAPPLCVCASVCTGAQPCMHVHVYTLL